MARKDKYESHVKPNLEKIKQLVTDHTEKQIAKMLGIGMTSFNKYKHEHPEFMEALKAGRELLVTELKDTLRKKAKGFHYTETKTSIREMPDGTTQKLIEKYEKYAQPDTGAIHLLLKNYDETWRNDDAVTVELKRRQVEVAEKKASANDWEEEPESDNEQTGQQ